jgi:hypothetical protein
MSSFKKTALAVACAGGMVFVGQAQAANWLLLQGTEPEGSAARAKVWGFLQAQYQKDFSEPNAAGAYVPPKLIGPDLTSQSAFNVNRARIGARGTGFPLDSKVNYFLLLEMGNNGITYPGKSFAKVTDASVTFNHIPGARVRAGLFKYPGAEEGLQAIHVFDYINFTEVSNQLLLERFPNQSFTPNVPPQTLPPATPLNAFDRPVGAFRDVGVQVFDAFNMANNWQVSYALMVGNGNGLNYSDNDNNKDKYGYLSIAKIFGGQGPRQEDFKAFIWTQRGKRTADLTGSGNFQQYTRNRSGGGLRYLQKPFRFTAEYMKGDGMIFIGPDKPTFDFNGAAPGGNGATGKASGWYVDGGWYVPKTKWELDLRYDLYDRLKDDRFEMKFKTWTAGVQYHFNKKSRVAFNYAWRNDEAINFPSGAGPNANLDGVKNRLGIQYTAIF